MTSLSAVMRSAISSACTSETLWLLASGSNTIACALSTVPSLFSAGA
jgi:hypothetical protein